jgi:hypothetical protein
MLIFEGVVLNLSFQHHALSAPFSFNLLRFINSAFALRLDWNLPLCFLLPLATFVAFSLVPAAIWSGAVTPNVVLKNITIPFTVPSIGIFNGAPKDNVVCPWLSGDTLDLNKQQPTSFSGCKSKLSLLNSAATSSAINVVPGNKETKAPVHAKLDRAGYSFIGRSYGTGGSVGFVNISQVQTPLFHSFEETGLQAEVECIVNKTAEFRLEELFSATDGMLVFTTHGNHTLPEGLSIEPCRQSARISADVFAWGSVYNNRSTSWFSLAAVPDICLGGETGGGGGCEYGFRQLHQTQCQLNFTARKFDVKVDNTGRTISVSPGPSIEWPSDADALLNELSSSYNDISCSAGTSGGSLLGTAIHSNINILRALRNDTSFNEETMLHSVEHFIADLTDNHLMSFVQARYFSSPEERRSVNADITKYAVVYGEAKFIYAAFVLNLSIIIICAIEALRTQFWKYISNLDFLDTASVAVGASLGGTELASHVQMLSMRPEARDVSGAVKVRVRDVNGPTSAIELANNHYSGVGEDNSMLLSLVSSRK